MSTSLAQEQKTLVVELSRDVVRRIAPEEIPIFQATSRAYFEDPDRVIEGTDDKQEMVSFGIPEVVNLLTPTVLGVVTEVIKVIAVDSTKTTSTTVIVAWFRRLLRRIFGTGASTSNGAGAEGSEAARTKLPPRLPPERLDQVRQVAFDKARQLQLDEARANLLADSIIGGLMSPAMTAGAAS